MGREERQSEKGRDGERDMGEERGWQGREGMVKGQKDECRKKERV